MKKSYHGIGLMSGTSLDGLDVAYCIFDHTKNGWNHSIIHADTIAYPAKLLEQLKSAKGISALELVKLDVAYGRWMGKVCQEFILEYKIQPQFISSHGYTVFHQPENGLTKQIGNGFELYNTCQITVIYNFRQLDVALGGQGAPLVPIGDQMLFGQFDYILNLGGFANISFQKNRMRIAGDICPVNVVLNILSQKMGTPYDEKGKYARAGNFNAEIFDELNQNPFYTTPFPKSLGAEWVDENIWQPDVFGKTDTKDLLHTYIHHIGFQITNSIHKNNYQPNSTILCTGGGTHNQYLIETIEHYLGNNKKVIVPEKNVIDYKEAMIFAFLGLLRLRNETNIFASVTGARKDTSSGQIISAENCIFNR